MCDWESSHQSRSHPGCACFNPWKGLCVIERGVLVILLIPCSVFKVSIPERDYVWLRGCVVLLTLSRLLFQSLKGIMCDWEFHSVGLANFVANQVSIPERDYVWLREPSGRSYQPAREQFQSLKGIMCDWEFILNILSFVGAVSIPERDYVWLRVNISPMPSCHIGFNPWKGLCVIESQTSPASPWCSHRRVSIPERDYVWLRVCTFKL